MIVENRVWFGHLKWLVCWTVKLAHNWCVSLWRNHFSSAYLYNNKGAVSFFQGQIDAQLDTLTQEQINGVCHSIGVASMYPLVTNPPSTPLSQHPSCQPLAIQAFMVTHLSQQQCQEQYLHYGNICSVGKNATMYPFITMLQVTDNDWKVNDTSGPFILS